MNYGFFILYNMRITRTSKEIVDIVNETIGMDICHADYNGNIKIDANNDAEGNEIYFHDYIFCSEIFYHYVNQQRRIVHIRPYFILNTFSMGDDEFHNDRCFNSDGEHDGFCDFSVNADGIGIWTFDEETFINVLEGLKIAFKAKTAQQIVILGDDEDFAV